MATRIQEFNGDTILEKVESKEVKERISEKEQIARKEYLEASIANFQTELADCEAKLAQLYAEKSKA